MIARVGNLLFVLGLTLWIGGMCVLGGLVAPSLFHRLPKAQAGEIFGFILQRYFYLELACGGASLLGASLSFIGSRRGAWADWVRIVCLTMMLLLTLGAGFGVHPKLRRLRDAGQESAGEFQSLHKTSERLALLNLAIGLGLLSVWAWGRRKEL